MIKLKDLLFEKIRYAPISNDDYRDGDTIKINPKEWPGYSFDWGTTGKVFDVEKSDYFSDDVTLLIKLKHKDVNGITRDILIVSNYYLLH